MALARPRFGLRAQCGALGSARLRLGDFQLIDGDEMNRPSNRPAPEELEELARRHLWVYFAPLSRSADVPVIVRGEGCYVYDDQGRQYIDGLAGLFLTNVGHGREELARVAYEQMNELHFFPLWTYTHPRAIELAAKLAELAPGDLNRVFFTTAAAMRWSRPGSSPSSTSEPSVSQSATR